MKAKLGKAVAVTRFAIKVALIHWSFKFCKAGSQIYFHKALLLVNMYQLHKT